jgi:hypothetical protein
MVQKESNDSEAGHPSKEDTFKDRSENFTENFIINWLFAMIKNELIKKEIIDGSESCAYFFRFKIIALLSRISI